MSQDRTGNSIKKTDNGVSVECHSNVVRQKTSDYYSLKFANHSQTCTLPKEFRDYSDLRIVVKA